jgi:hypothetical protein
MELDLKNMKKIILIFGLFLPISWSCEDNGFTSGGPISGELSGKWKLTKIVSSKSIKIDNQIGYTEIIEIGNDNVNDFEKIYKDDKLFKTYYRDRARTADMSAKNMTVLMRYSGNKERFYKILNWNVAGKVSLEASDYLEQVGSVQDTITYYYSFVK